jgi:hypothetical protein
MREIQVDETHYLTTSCRFDSGVAAVDLERRDFNAQARSLRSFGNEASSEYPTYKEKKRARYRSIDVDQKFYRATPSSTECRARMPRPRGRSSRCR